MGEELKSRTRGQASRWFPDWSRHVEDRQQRDVDAKELKAAPFEADAVAFRVVDHACRRDRPARALRTAAVARDRAGRVDGVVEGVHVVDPGPPGRGNTAAILKHDKEIVYGPVAQSVGELDGVAHDLVALRCDHDHIAAGKDLAAFAVPGDLVRCQIIAFPVHPDRAARGHDVRIAVVRHLVGAKRDDWTLVCSSRRREGLRRGGGQAPGGARRSRRLLRSSPCRNRQEHGQR